MQFLMLKYDPYTLWLECTCFLSGFGCSNVLSVLHDKMLMGQNMRNANLMEKKLGMR